MGESPLTLPVVITPTPATPSSIPTRPTRIATWTSTSTSTRHIAYTDIHNSLWIHSTTQPGTSSQQNEAGPSKPSIPTIHTLSDFASTTTPPRRPSNPRKHSSKTRPRADSIASSVLTTSSSKRVSLYSPPSTALIPQTGITNTTVSAAPHDSTSPHLGHHGTKSVDGKGRSDLIDQLREQRNRDTTGDGGIGLGFGRKIYVHSKDEIETNGLTSPPPGQSGQSRSTTSIESNRTASGLRGWFKSEEEKVQERDKEMKERLEEVEVQREMDREREEEKRESEEWKAVERCESSTPKMGYIKEGTTDGSGSKAQSTLKRILLGRRGQGTVVCLRVLDDIGVLAVLRDIGILELISLDTLEIVQSLSLEESVAGEGSSKSTLRLPAFWSWRSVHVAVSQGQAMIIAEGIPWPCAIPSPNGEVTRVVLLCRDVSGEWSNQAGLELPGTGLIAICERDQQRFILHFLPHSLTSYPITFPSSSPGIHRTSSPNPRSVSSNFPSPNLLHPGTPGGIRRSKSNLSMNDDTARSKEKEKETGFAKFLATRRIPQKEEADVVEAGIEEGIEVERDGYGDWSLVRMKRNGEGLGIGGNVIDVFMCDGRKLRVKGSIDAKDSVRDAASLGKCGEMAILTSSLDLYSRQGASDSRPSFDLVNSIPDVSCFGSQDDMIVLVGNKEVMTKSMDDLTKTQSIAEVVEEAGAAELAAILPYTAETVFVSDSTGTVNCQSLSSLITGEKSEADDLTSDRLESHVTLLKIVRRSQGDLVVAGDEDGVVRIWTAHPFELQGSWTLFADPVEGAAIIDSDTALSNILLCTSKYGTVALLNLEQMDLMYLIPASRSLLRRIFFDSKDILLAYANGKARVWNHQTCEFRRSTGLDAAEEMLAHGKWEEVLLHADESSSQSISPISETSFPNSDLSRSILLDIREIARSIHGTRSSSSPLPALRGLLSILLPFGKDEEVDTLCNKQLGIPKPVHHVLVGCSQNCSTATFECSAYNDLWPVSAETVGLRQLAIVTLLRPFLDTLDLEDPAVRVISFYCGAFSTNEPDLAFFAEYFVDTASDVQQAARILFKARLERMTEEGIEVLVEHYHHDLPIKMKGPDQNSKTAKMALTIIGGIILHKFQSVNPVVLKSAADSLYLYLSDPKSPHLSLAIELAHKSFSTYQTYLDPMDLLRRFFHLSTHTPPPASISAHARLAVLDIAASFQGLFMSTLSMDILDAETLERRTSIMKLCVFVARKKPALIQHGLPRIAESVVRSLDPNIGKMREEVQEAATVILNELVLAFSTIDFHSGTQRLAVGTHEGAVIMYDLKTASRLYVLEPHHAPVSSVNFSPDGRRLLTVSLEEGNVTVWKVGSSLSGFFTVGGPPRQGAGKGEPFKRIEFMRADQGPLDETSALSDVKVDWPGNRQARVQIRETALNFET